MKPALSLLLVLRLVTPVVPVTAQGPLATDRLPRSITGEAAAAAQENQSAEAEWSRVQQLALGTEVVLAVNGSHPERAYIVQADAFDLKVRRSLDPGALVETVGRTGCAEIRAVRVRGSRTRAGALAAGGLFGGALGGGIVIVPVGLLPGWPGDPRVTLSQMERRVCPWIRKCPADRL